MTIPVICPACEEEVEQVCDDCGECEYCCECDGVCSECERFPCICDEGGIA